MVGFPWFSRATEVLLRLQILVSRRARDEALLSEARRLDADAVGLRADERRRARDQAARGLGRPGR